MQWNRLHKHSSLNTFYDIHKHKLDSCVTALNQGAFHHLQYSNILLKFNKKTILAHLLPTVSLTGLFWLYDLSNVCLLPSQRVRWRSLMCQKNATILHSSQSKTNDPCVDPCVVLKLTLLQLLVLDNQSIACLSLSMPLSFVLSPLTWFSCSPLSLSPNCKLRCLHSQFWSSFSLSLSECVSVLV